MIGTFGCRRLGGLQVHMAIGPMEVEAAQKAAQ